ncbi:MAG: LLM class flavin-dependent oxidoreductase [Alphaproteobacteria bacterium]|jgi:alkanesulfonate monooxygenase SsuD/methylene tetrahydromethanopterin reductase-like flavin-dependent oxidoreductase (luciferase family)
MDISDFSVFPMQWGVKPAEAQEMVEVAVHAEELGFYSVTIPHVPILYYGHERPPDGFVWAHFPPEYKDYQHDSLVLLPMIAQATSRIKIGFNVAVTPWLHPFVWAKYLASLDAATQGRVIAGFGLGAVAPGKPSKALHSLGIEGKRGEMSDEALDIIMRLWTEDEPLSFDGKYHKGIDLVVEPKPTQKPHPEFWWAGLAKAGARRAAQYGGMLEVTWPSLRRVREELAPNHTAANEKYGGDSRLGILMYANLMDGGDMSAEDLSRHYFGWQGEALDPIAAGSPERCAEVLGNYRDAGIEHFVLDLHRHGLDHVNHMHDQMERFANEVVPMMNRNG